MPRYTEENSITSCQYSSLSKSATNFNQSKHIQSFFYPFLSHTRLFSLYCTVAQRHIGTFGYMLKSGDRTCICLQKDSGELKMLDG